MAYDIVTASRMRQIFETAASTPGVVAIFSGAKRGKTRLAEALVSSGLRQLGAREYSPNLLPEVVDSAARTWLAPAAVRAAVAGGVITEKASSEWARSALQAVGLQSENDVKSVLALCKHIKFHDVKEKAKLLSWQQNGSSVECYVKAPSSADEVENTSEIYIQIANADIYPGVDLMAKVTEDGFLEVVRAPKGLRPATASEITSSALNQVEGSRLEGNVITGEPDAVGVSVQMKDVLHANSEERSSIAAENWQASLFDDESNDDNGGEDQNSLPNLLPSHYIKFTETSVSLHVATNGELNHERVTIEDVHFVDSAMISAGGSADRKVDASIDEVIAVSPLNAYELFVTFGVVSEVVQNDNRIAAKLGRVLQNLAILVEMTNNPVLVETEDKATDAYGAIARSASLEDRKTHIELSTESAVLSFCVPESLMMSSVGAMLINPIVHISVLDLTMVYDLAVKSTTRKGGLDSSQLNMMQHISGIARRCGAVVIVETRDDFFGADASDAEQVGARDTLGANSRIAIHIVNDDTDNDARRIWVRVKGYDDFEDGEFEASGVTLANYPDSLIRSHGSLPSFLDRKINEVKNWMAMSVRKLFKL